MTDNAMVGDENGIALWNLMANTEDVLEQKYFARLNKAASEFGTVWFTDIMTQRNTKRNQTVWNLVWKNSRWEVSRFHIPNGAEEVTARIRGEEEVIELSINDILVED